MLPVSRPVQPGAKSTLRVNKFKKKNPTKQKLRGEKSGVHHGRGGSTVELRARENGKKSLGVVERTRFKAKGGAPANKHEGWTSLSATGGKKPSAFR